MILADYHFKYSEQVIISRYSTGDIKVVCGRFPDKGVKHNHDTKLHHDNKLSNSLCRVKVHF